MNELEIEFILKKWVKILRIENNWDVDLKFIDDIKYEKTGDIKIDVCDKKAIMYLNKNNPKNENMEEVIIHELLHLKMYPLDQLTETLINNHYELESNSYNMMYEQFMISLEITVEELTKCFLEQFSDNNQLSYGRVEKMKSYNDLFKGLSNLN